MSMTEAVKRTGKRGPRKPKALAPLPVKGYTAQSPAAVDLVNEGKELQERVLRYLDGIGGVRDIGPNPLAIDPRCLAIGKTQIETGFMWVFRSVFNPQRIALPEDEPAK